MRLCILYCGLIASTVVGCAETRGSGWVERGMSPEPERGSWVSPKTRPEPLLRDMRSRTLGHAEDQMPDATASDSTDGTSLGVFRNTYYAFPNAADYSTGPTVSVFAPDCRPIATVSEAFFDTLCVQGSGRLQSQQTVSFASRGCSCARVCPRSGQQICFELLDADRFPWGRGATGGPITPLRTVAVDTQVIALGTRLYIPRFEGLQLPNGGMHDGCFVAEDRGLRVVGKHVDIFAGDESTLRVFNRQVPTGLGLEVFIDPAHCGTARASR